ncbi:hypothetical protein GCM10020216_013090 [Nonomuraea helvata]
MPYLPPVVPFSVNRVMRFDDEDLSHCIARELLMRLVDVKPADLVEAGAGRGEAGRAGSPGFLPHVGESARDGPS